MAGTRQQRTQRQHRSAHGLDQLVRRFGVDRVGGLEAHAATLAVGLDLDTHVFQQAAHGGDVAQARHIVQAHRFAGQQRGTHFGQCGVLGAGDGNRPVEGLAATDQEFVHVEIL